MCTSNSAVMGEFMPKMADSQSWQVVSGCLLRDKLEHLVEGATLSVNYSMMFSLFTQPMISKSEHSKIQEAEADSLL
jgi:hypothetical protein